MRGQGRGLWFQEEPSQSSAGASGPGAKGRAMPNYDCSAQNWPGVWLCLHLLCLKYLKHGNIPVHMSTYLQLKVFRMSHVYDKNKLSRVKRSI